MKIFISQPMSGLTDEQIQQDRQRIISAVGSIFSGQEIEVLDSFFKNFTGDPLEYLGKALAIMAEADCVVFAEGWKESRGCSIEHLCAVQYGKNFVEL